MEIWYNTAIDKGGVMVGRIRERQEPEASLSATEAQLIAV